LNYGSYIQVELEPGAEKYTTNIQLHTNNPVFDETAEFPEISSDELLNMTLKLRLCTVDRFSHSTLVGQVRASLAELDFNPEKPTTIWRPITPHDQQVGNIDGL
jgi:Ca2+-dependent lipid-binding protein